MIKQGQEDTEAEGIINRLNVLNIIISKDWGSYEFFNNSYDPKASGCGWNEGRWKILELKLIEEAASRLNKKLNGKIASTAGRVNVKKSIFASLNKGAMAPPIPLNYVMGDIVFYSDANQDPDPGKDNTIWYKYTFVHEYGHVWDYHTGNRLSFGLMKELGTWRTKIGDREGIAHGTRDWYPYAPIPSNNSFSYPEPPPDTASICFSTPNNYPPSPSNSEKYCKKYPYSSTYGNGGPSFTGPGAEDWATSLGFFVIDEMAKRYDSVGLDDPSIRRQYVQKQIDNLK